MLLQLRGVPIPILQSTFLALNELSLALRRSKSDRALDLRLELRKAPSQVTRDVHTAKEKLALVKKSRQHILAATGLGNSGATVAWLQEFETDEAAVSRWGLFPKHLATRT